MCGYDGTTSRDSYLTWGAMLVQSNAVTHFLAGHLNTGLLSDHHVLLWISKVDRRSTVLQVAGATLIRFCMWTLIICILNKGFAFCWHCWHWTEQQQKCGRTWWDEEQLSWFALSHVTLFSIESISERPLLQPLRFLTYFFSPFVVSILVSEVFSQVLSQLQMNDNITNFLLKQ